MTATVGASGEQPRYPLRSSASFGEKSVLAMGSETVFWTVGKFRDVSNKLQEAYKIGQ